MLNVRFVKELLNLELFRENHVVNCNQPIQQFAREMDSVISLNERAKDS